MRRTDVTDHSERGRMSHCRSALLIRSIVPVSTRATACLAGLLALLALAPAAWAQTRTIRGLRVTSGSVTDPVTVTFRNPYKMRWRHNWSMDLTVLPDSTSVGCRNGGVSRVGLASPAGRWGGWKGRRIVATFRPDPASEDADRTDAAAPPQWCGRRLALRIFDAPGGECKQRWRKCISTFYGGGLVPIARGSGVVAEYPIRLKPGGVAGGWGIMINESIAGIRLGMPAAEAEARLGPATWRSRYETGDELDGAEEYIWGTQASETSVAIRVGALVRDGIVIAVGAHVGADRDWYRLPDGITTVDELKAAHPEARCEVDSYGRRRCVIDGDGMLTTLEANNSGDIHRARITPPELADAVWWY